MPSANRQLRVGLQSKAALILAFVILSVAVSGGWFYLANVRSSLRRHERAQALRLAQSLAASASVPLQSDDPANLSRLAGDFLRSDGVRFVAVLDDEGRILASASSPGHPDAWPGLTGLGPSVVDTQQVTSNILTLALPVLVHESDVQQKLVGAVRLVLDTSATTASIAEAQQRVTFVAAALALCAIPIAYLLVWRVLIQPLRRLAGVTHRLAGGEYSARANLRRQDEIGDLAGAFDAMAEQIQTMRRQLLDANEQLEQKVADRTARLEHANERLRREMAEKREFLRAVSHDLNAPLRNIAGVATLILMRYRDELPEDVVARLQRIQANVDRQTDLIEELLELSRIQSRPQRRENVDLNHLLNELRETFEFELTNRKIELVIEDELPTLHIESKRIRQVFQNLIDNAIKYMDRPVGGRIEIGCRPEQHRYVLFVRDNGPGIPPEAHPRIFQVFRRMENAATAGVQGKGVGLTMVKTVMGNHGGDAWVESEPGHGATFFVSFDAESTRPGRENVSPYWRGEQTCASIPSHDE